ncbi:hypothetical protein DFH09DRAFT_195705 [Mycena vulgaris]|nr:hypothetical protein DFH09DRAFT_195705 [Mycena vulgaris]
MHSPAWTIAAFLALNYALLVNAGVFFIEPASRSTCTGGTPCTLEWLDDGIPPFLNQIGVVTAGLFHGEQELVQTIQPLDVSTVHSVQFTPNAQAGPNSGAYYVAFTSTNAKVNGTKYIAFSPFFNLKGMSGSFSSPLAAATSTIPIPTSLTVTTSTPAPTTITIGGSASLPPLPTLSSAKPITPSSSSLSSQFTTSSIPTSASDASISASATTSPSSTPTSSSNAAASPPATLLSLPILAFLSLCVLGLSSIS